MYNNLSARQPQILPPMPCACITVFHQEIQSIPFSLTLGLLSDLLSPIEWGRRDDTWFWSWAWALRDLAAFLFLFLEANDQVFKKGWASILNNERLCGKKKKPHGRELRDPSQQLAPRPQTWVMPSWILCPSWAILVNTMWSRADPPPLSPGWITHPRNT